MKQKIAIQGIEASFHEMAALKYFGEQIEVVECMTFQSLCETLQNNKADFAVMAIENSIAGSLLQNYALLIKYGFTIIGEVYLNIQMHLMGLPEDSLDTLTTIKSHPIALRQSSEFIWGLNNIKTVEVEDTALAAKQIANNQEKGTGALANKLAAERFGLKILKERVETHKQNFTRFLVLSKANAYSGTPNKASVRVQLKHENGALAKVLAVFSEFNINLTKIQSVPIIGKPYEYSFHIDMEWDDKKAYKNSLLEIEPFITDFKLLGEYKKGTFNLLEE